MNIVFAFADDWGKYASTYSTSVNELIKTPNIDFIANEGVKFDNAFVPAPSCTPCRSSLLSGRYFWQTGLGAILLGAKWDGNIPTFPLELEKNGYDIGYSYKVWAPGKNPHAPYGGSRNAYNEHGLKFNQFSQHVTELAKTMSVEEAKNEILGEVYDNFTDFLDTRDENKPFCYWFGPTNTHRTWVKGSGKKLWGIEPDTLNGIMPKSIPDEEDTREDFADYLGECMAYDASVGVLIDKLKEIGEFDNTLFVVSGDHGVGGMPRGKCNLYNLGCEVALMMRYPERIQKGRVVDDFVNIMDLAPTFLEMSNVEVPEGMTARSIVPILDAKESGTIEPDRDFVVMGRERHVDYARLDYLPYPQRAIRTKDFLYICNFEPDRYPVGDPCGLEDDDYEIPYEKLQWQLTVAYPDMDMGPTKAFLVCNRKEDRVKPYYELAFNKRPYEELFDLKNDPDTVVNVAQQDQYAETMIELRSKLWEVLTEEKDPRVAEGTCKFEQYPYTQLTTMNETSKGWIKEDAIEQINQFVQTSSMEDIIQLVSKASLLNLNYEVIDLISKPFFDACEKKKEEVSPLVLLAQWYFTKTKPEYYEEFYHRAQRILKANKGYVSGTTTDLIHYKAVLDAMIFVSEKLDRIEESNIYYKQAMEITEKLKGEFITDEAVENNLLDYLLCVKYEIIDKKKYQYVKDFESATEMGTIHKYQDNKSQINPFYDLLTYSVKGSVTGQDCLPTILEISSKYYDQKQGFASGFQVEQEQIIHTKQDTLLAIAFLNCV